MSLRYVPVIEKITTWNGNEKIVEWQGRILNLYGFKVTDPSRDTVEKGVDTRLKKVLFRKTEET